MIGLLLLGFLIVFICSSWIAMRKVATLDLRWQALITAPLICVVLLVPIQVFAGYSLASPTLLQTAVFAACAACFPLMFLLWQSRRRAYFPGVLVPALFLIPNLIVGLAVLSTPLSNASTVPAVEGQISPSASFRVALYMRFLDFGTPTYTYEIYRNPRGLPFVWKEVANGADPCGKGLDAKGLLIEPGPNDNVLVLSCRKPEPRFSSIQIPIG
jgi:hypothetical protein